MVRTQVPYWQIVGHYFGAIVSLEFLRVSHAACGNEAMEETWRPNHAIVSCVQPSRNVER